VQLLSDAAKSHSTPDLLHKLQQLLDFLNIPGPVSKYLPDMGSIPFQHLSVLDIYIEEAAAHAVDLMLRSSMFSNTSSTGSSGAAFFSVFLKEEVSSHYELVVYALSGGRLSAWPKGSTENFMAYSNVQAVQLPEGANGASSGSGSNCGPKGGEGSGGGCSPAQRVTAGQSSGGERCKGGRETQEGERCAGAEANRCNLLLHSGYRCNWLC
jgi:hypothetical protein